MNDVRFALVGLRYGDDGRWSVLLCLAAQACVDTGAPIRIDEFAGGSHGAK